MKKKKALIVAVMALMSTLLLTGCCNHEWAEATCGTAKTCTLCGKTEGEPTGAHIWKDATCTEPKTCAVCGETEGEALGHKFGKATCTKPKTCSVCKETEGEALGHKWESATCTEPQTCSRCKKTEGEALGHTVTDWEVTKEATCTVDGEKLGKCSLCKEIVTQKIDKIEHTPGEWKVTKEATLTDKGTKSKTCIVCGQTVDSMEYKKEAGIEGDHFNFSSSEFLEYCNEYLYPYTFKMYSGGEIKGAYYHQVFDYDGNLILVMGFMENDEGYVNLMAFRNTDTTNDCTALAFMIFIGTLIDPTINEKSAIASLLDNKELISGEMAFLISSDSEYSFLIPSVCWSSVSSAG